MRRDWIDIGGDMEIAFTAWRPDRDLNPQYAHLPDTDKLGLMIRCKHDHRGSLMFDGPVAREVFPGHPMWQVVSLEPLTLQPSIRMNHGDAGECHGFIENGRWRDAGSTP